MLETLRALCSLDGVSGCEYPVREYILGVLSGIEGVSCSVDALGNVIAAKRGASRAGQRLLLDAHMDEVGFYIRYITDDGLLKFAKVGGIDTRVFLGRTVLVGERRVPGAVGVKPKHLLKDDEEKNIPGEDELYIDIGTSTREEAQSLVSVGDPVVFDSDFIEFGEGFIKSRALDDRAGCAILLEILKSELPYDITAAFSVQEEVGLRGAGAAAFSVEPQLAVAVETTTAADLPGVENDSRACVLGGGAVLSFMDRATIYDRELFDTALRAASEMGISAQIKTLVAGGNNSGAIHRSRGGVRTLAVSLPCRYLHSPSCVIKLEDLYSTYNLLLTLIGIFASDKG